MIHTPLHAARRAARAAAALLLLLPGAASASPLVAVAANMSQAATEIAGAFEAHTGIKVRLSFGASGNLARQVLRGAPYEVFVSADEDYPLVLHRAGRAPDAGERYARGRLVLYLPPDSPVALPPGSADAAAAIATALAHPQLQRLAIANPEHAPYGRAARESLVHLGLWPRLRGRLVLGESVTQSARFVQTRDVQAALLPLALALVPALSGGTHVLVPESWHGPIHQRVVLLAGAGEQARRFFAFMLGEQARAVLARHGYELPPAPG